MNIPTPPQDPPTRREGDLSRPQWNYENCQAQLGTAIVGKCPATWWCAHLVGQRVPAIKVIYGDTVFYIHDDEQGRSKVFQRGGGPGSGHSSLSSATDFEPESEVYGRPPKPDARPWYQRRVKTGGTRRKRKRS